MAVQETVLCSATKGPFELFNNVNNVVAQQIADSHSFQIRTLGGTMPLLHAN